MKKKTTAIILAMAMAASLAACGGNSAAKTDSAPAEEAAEETEEAEAPEEGAEETTEAASGEGVTLTIAARGGTYAEVIKAAIPAFEEENGCKVELLELEGDDLHSKLALDAPNAEGAYDLAMVDGSWVAEFTENNVAANLTELGFAYDDDLIPATYSTLTVDGDAYFAPFFGNVTVMMYNKELVEQAGYKPEDITSWEDIQAIAEAVHANGKNGFVTRGGGADPVLTDFLPVLFAHGGTLVDENNQPTVNNDTFKAALQQYMDLVALGQTMEKDDMVANIENGNGALATIWPGWYAPTADGAADYIVAPTKLTKDGEDQNTSVLGVWELAVLNNSTHKELAVKLLQHIIDPEVQLASVEVGGVPCRESVLTNADVLAAHPQYAIIKEALESGNSRPTITQWNEYCETLGTELDNIIKGTESIDDGLANAQSDLEMVMMD
ncbi:MAG: extracellular solute-binding protein [Eubacteriales bacterium]|nr:extracellular solute-binding protein [Eubacteriales bacterium]